MYHGTIDISDILLYMPSWYTYMIIVYTITVLLPCAYLMLV